MMQLASFLKFNAVVAMPLAKHLTLAQSLPIST